MRVALTHLPHGAIRPGPHLVGIVVTHLLLQAAPPSGLAEILIQSGPIVLIFLVFYFLVIRPQSQERAKHDAFLAALKPGDAVVTTGGIYGTIRELTAVDVQLEIAKNTVIRLQRGSIGGPAGAPAATPKKEK